MRKNLHQDFIANSIEIGTSRKKSFSLATKKGDLTFVKIPIVLLSDRSLSTNAKVIWAYLRFRQGNNETAWPSQETIAAHTGISRSTISRATSALRTKGWLTVNTHYVDKRSSNSYRTHIPESALQEVWEYSKSKEGSPNYGTSDVSNLDINQYQIEAAKDSLKDSLKDPHESTIRA